MMLFASKILFLTINDYKLIKSQQLQMRRLFSTINKEKILNSTYESLADQMAARYKSEEYRHTNAKCLHEIQLQFNIFKPGNWILDIGAGPDYLWTDVALKFIQNEQSTHRVISNDLFDIVRTKPNNIFVKGNFLDEPTRTNIALHIKQKTLDTILVDVSPQYTGQVDHDASAILDVFQEVMKFSDIFLKKGGNIVCKMLESDSEKLMQQYCKIVFHQCTKYVPSVVRRKSPVCFYVLKGFQMSYHFAALNEFLSVYKGSTERRIAIVKEYQNKYNWDPIDVLNKKAKEDILKFKMNGKSDYQIAAMFQVDPFIKVNEILNQINRIFKAQIEKDDIEKVRAVREFTNNAFYNSVSDVPLTREEFVTFLETQYAKAKQIVKKKEQQKERRKKKNIKKDHGPVKNNDLLGDDQIYMKGNLKIKEQKQQKIYLQNDLRGRYEEVSQDKILQRQLQKLKEAFPQTKQKIEEFQKSDRKYVDLQRIFNFNEKVDPHKQELKQIIREEKAHDILDEAEYKLKAQTKPQFYDQHKDAITSKKYNNHKRQVDPSKQNKHKKSTK